MVTNTINASLCAKMFLAGAKNLESKKEWINELNVFPVPDGDTGTNMSLTIMAAAKEVMALEKPDMKNLGVKVLICGGIGGGARTALGPEIRPDRKSTRLNSSHSGESRMPSSA